MRFILIALAVLLPSLALAQGNPKPGIGKRLGDAMDDRNKALNDAMNDTPAPAAPVAVDGKWIERKLSDGKAVRLYIAHPPIAAGQKANLPALVVIQEWWGVNDDIQERTRDFATRGYYAVAVDLYDGKVAKTPAEASALKKALTDPAALARLQVGTTYLADQARAGSVDTNRIAAIGWCMGGEQALKLALADNRIKAICMFYGTPVTDPAKLKTLQGPLLGIFGKEDKGIPNTLVDQFEKALTDAKAKFEIHRYDGVGHAFASKSAKASGNYNEAKATEAWNVTYAWLDKTLKPAK